MNPFQNIKQFQSSEKRILVQFKWYNILGYYRGIPFNYYLQLWQILSWKHTH